MLTRRDYDEEKYRKDYRINITMVGLEYLARLEDIYLQKKENDILFTLVRFKNN